MSPKEKMDKLERLLARVKERAEAPRPTGAVAVPATRAPTPARAPTQSYTTEREPQAARNEMAAMTEPPAAAAQVATAPPPSRISTHPPPTIESAPPAVAAGWSSPPTAELVEEEDDDVETTIGEAYEIDADSDAEVSHEVVELDIDVDEPGMMMPAESGAQPVAEHVESEASAEVEVSAAEQDDDLDDMTTELVAGSTPPLYDEAQPQPPPPAPPANEVQEPAPSSSPRPIATEQPSYEEESAPRHTPPPESGKQVAAPSVKPEPRKSSVPPAAEGHTLMGGWREPGIAIPREPAEAPRPPPPRVPPPPPPPPPDLIRSAPPPPPPPPAAVVRPSAVPVPRAAEPSVRLGPEVTAARLPASAAVASIHGAAPSFAPSSFGDLLDATMAI